jgi:alpha-tubulin suppressor-like RCC1 family protein
MQGNPSGAAVQMDAVPWKQPYLGDLELCGVREDGSLWFQDDLNGISMTPMSAPTNWVRVACADGELCAINDSGAVWCSNDTGTPIPQFIQGIAPATSISVSGVPSSACGVSNDGTGWCVSLPQQEDRVMNLGQGWSQIVDDGTMFYALATDGSLSGWGSNEFGLLGLPSDVHPAPVAVTR